MPTLTDEQIQTRLALSSWSREDQAIVREWKLTNFERAIEFVNQVARLAQAADHHPDILVHGWNKVRLALSTHSAGGLTAADFELAAQIDALV
ncbi:MAG TPA: 4a-hydroxytetrahydrobiopterin dehydratase [Solirubrobacteraceae bacterium]|nr:4a-hydroxytetrahydrobiopterin dehydratase [Solirubrobacteraceae bacterium]